MENYLVSARKYRPDSFETVVGQSALTTTLKNAVKNNQLAHAYLFCGPRGVGKTTCARIFAKTINCLHPTPEGEACNACESCLSFNDQRSLNIFELDAASNNSVDGIRTLVDQVRIPPQLGKYKVYIIDEVHMLSTAAFNAFLKTLEEPPHHAIFILATTEKHKIIPTILSRCQIHDFNRISVNDIVDQLKRIANAEGTEAEDEALTVIAVKADGGMRDALSIFDQVASYGNGAITYQHTIENLNVLDYDYYFKLTDALLEGKVSDALLIFNDILNHGFEGQHFITGLSSHFRDLLVCRDQATLVLLEVGASIRERYLEQAQRCQPDFLYVAIKFCNDADLAYRESKNKRLLVELALIRIAQLSESKKKIREYLIDDEPAPLLPLLTPPQPSVVPVAQHPVAKATAAPTVTTATTKQTKQATQAQPANNLSEYKSIRSIRINRKPLSDQEEASKTTRLTDIMNQPYTEEAVQKAWLSYIDQLSEDIHLANGMKTCKPAKIDEHLYEVVVSNPVLQKKLLDNKAAIEAWLHLKLFNSHVKYQVKLDETSTQTRPYTNRDRLEHMIRKNPAMLEFYKLFGLDLD